MTETNPDILLFPGLNGSGRFHQMFIAALHPQWTCSVIPLPRSGAQNYDFLTEHYSSLLQARNRPAILIGESFSGPLVYQLYKRHPEQVSALIFAASFIENPRPFLSQLEPKSTLLQWGQKIPAEWLYRFAFKPAGAQGFTPPDGRYKQEFLDERAQLDARIWSERLRAVQALSRADTRISKPCLYLQPSRDYLIPRRASACIKLWAENFTVAPLYGTHLILQTNPEQSADIIKKWLIEQNLQAHHDLTSIQNADTGYRSS